MTTHPRRATRARTTVPMCTLTTTLSMMTTRQVGATASSQTLCLIRMRWRTSLRDGGVCKTCIVDGKRIRAHEQRPSWLPCVLHASWGGPRGDVWFGAPAPAPPTPWGAYERQMPCPGSLANRKTHLRWRVGVKQLGGPQLPPDTIPTKTHTPLRVRRPDEALSLAIMPLRVVCTVPRSCSSCSAASTSVTHSSGYRA